jgi:hypothetical protein
MNLTDQLISKWSSEPELQMGVPFRRMASDATELVKPLQAAHDGMLEAIQYLHQQKGDDRCIFDDDKLYAAAGLPPPDRRIGDKAAMLENCKRYIDLRCESGGWPTYAQLEEERNALRAKVCELQLDLLEARAKSLKG